GSESRVSAHPFFATDFASFRTVRDLSSGCQARNPVAYDFLTPPPSLGRRTPPEGWRPLPSTTIAQFPSPLQVKPSPLYRLIAAISKPFVRVLYRYRATGSRTCRPAASCSRPVTSRTSTRGPSPSRS